MEAQTARELSQRWISIGHIRNIGLSYGFIATLLVGSVHSTVQRPLLQLQPEQIGFGATGRLCLLASLFVEGITAQVQGVYLRLAFLFLVRVFGQAVSASQLLDWPGCLVYYLG